LSPDAAHGAGVGFYGDFVSSLIGQRFATFAAVAAFVELFIGIGLVLGLAVRPIAILGSVYMVHLTLATWYVPGPNQPLSAYLDNAGKMIPLLFLFALFGLGHA
jgi:uncharacterized membrane protein YphA (DoxX/SURF4 family)